MLITYFLRARFRERGRDTRLIDLHEWGTQEGDEHPSDASMHTCKTCRVTVKPASVGGRAVHIPSIFPCETLRLLAAEFRDHQLFENRWLPLMDSETE